MVTAVHHINVTVPSKLEAAAKLFYAEILGLSQIPKPVSSRQSGAWYELGNVQLHLSIEDEPMQLSSRHICFTVSDLAKAEATFRAAGMEIVTDPRPIPGTSRFYVRDPGGNLLEIAQAK